MVLQRLELCILDRTKRIDQLEHLDQGITIESIFTVTRLVLMSISLFIDTRSVNAVFAGVADHSLTLFEDKSNN